MGNSSSRPHNAHSNWIFYQDPQPKFQARVRSNKLSPDDFYFKKRNDLLIRTRSKNKNTRDKAWVEFNEYFRAFGDWPNEPN